jgi:hypothetical protein
MRPVVPNACLAALAEFVELVDRGEPEDALVKTIVDWLAEIPTEAEARTAAALIESLHPGTQLLSAYRPIYAVGFRQAARQRLPPVPAARVGSYRHARRAAAGQERAPRRAGGVEATGPWPARAARRLCGPGASMPAALRDRNVEQRAPATSAHAAAVSHVQLARCCHF